MPSDPFPIHNQLCNLQSFSHKTSKVHLVSNSKETKRKGAAKTNNQLLALHAAAGLKCNKEPQIIWMIILVDRYVVFSQQNLPLMPGLHSRPLVFPRQKRFSKCPIIINEFTVWSPQPSFSVPQDKCWVSPSNVHRHHRFSIPAPYVDWTWSPAPCFFSSIIPEYLGNRARYMRKCPPLPKRVTIGQCY